MNKNEKRKKVMVPNSGKQLQFYTSAIASALKWGTKFRYCGSDANHHSLIPRKAPGTEFQWIRGDTSLFSLGTPFRRFHRFPRAIPANRKSLCWKLPGLRELAKYKKSFDDGCKLQLIRFVYCFIYLDIIHCSPLQSVMPD